MDDKAKNKLERAKQIFQSVELYFKETVNVTDALERKATIFFSVFMSIATACIAITIRFVSFKPQNIVDITLPYFIFCLLLVVGLYIASCFFAYALKPKRGFKLPGNIPRVLKTKLEAEPAISLYSYIMWQIEAYGKMIETNCKINNSKGKAINRGLLCVLIAFSMALILFALIAYSVW